MIKKANPSYTHQQVALGRWQTWFKIQILTCVHWKILTAYFGRARFARGMGSLPRLFRADCQQETKDTARALAVFERYLKTDKHASVKVYDQFIPLESALRGGLQGAGGRAAAEPDGGVLAAAPAPRRGRAGRRRGAGGRRGAGRRPPAAVWNTG